MVTGKVRLSYVNLFTPRVGQNGGAAKYSTTILIPKSDTVTLQNINMAIEKAIQDGVSGAFGGQRPQVIAIPLYDGDGVRPGGDPFGAECAGHMVITGSSLQQPQVVDANVQPILNPSEVYSGMYGRVSLNFFPYNKAGKRGIGCGLNNVQKLEDGTQLGGGTTAMEDFGGAPQMQPSYQQAYQAPATQQPQAPVMQRPYAPQQQVPIYQQPYAPQNQTPVMQQPAYQQQAPIQQIIDPITGLPVSGGGVMGV